ncbi:MAG: hypothetical protein J6R46_09360, partial [Clostridia bacterium]|nr:hypothetical protein [Clostridia bacterium]
RFAAEELRTFLSQVFASDVPQVQEESPGKVQIYLGECDQLAKAGFSTKDLPRDAFILAVKDGKIIERGSHAELMAEKGYYYRLYTRQYEDEQTSIVLDKKE